MKVQKKVSHCACLPACLPVLSVFVYLTEPLGPIEYGL